MKYIFNTIKIFKTTNKTRKQKNDTRYKGKNREIKKVGRKWVSRIFLKFNGIN